jgi:hypothetical protein
MVTREADSSEARTYLGRPMGRPYPVVHFASVSLEERWMTLAWIGLHSPRRTDAGVTLGDFAQPTRESGTESPSPS